MNPASTRPSSAPFSVLVTGAAGFVGTRVVELLSGQGHRVTAVGRTHDARSERLAALPGVGYRTVDLSDSGAIADAVAGHTHVVHMAAVRTQDSGSNPRASHDVNVGSTFDLLVAARDHGVERFLYGSSHTVYGAFRDAAAAPFREDQTGGTGRGLNMYAATKLAAEAYLEAFASAGGPSYLSLRLGTIYGPRLSAGSNAEILTRMLRAIDAGERPVVPWTKRSLHALIYVDDVANATVAALDADAENLAINVVGRPVSSEIVYTRLVELYGDDPESIEWREQHERFQLVDRTRYEGLLGGERGTPLDEGLERLIEWHRAAD